MIVGKYFNDGRMQEWYLGELGKAREVLEQFNLLNQLFEGFRGYEEKQYAETRNVVLVTCLPDFEGRLKPNSIKSLAQIEESINLFNIIKWTKASLNQFKSRLCDDSYDTSISAYTELMMARYLAERFGRSNVWGTPYQLC